MPSEVPTDPGTLDRWFGENLLPLLLTAAVLVVLYRVSLRILPLAVRRALAAQRRGSDDDLTLAVELDKRVATIESFARTLIRLAIAAVLIIIVIGLLGLWGLLAGVGLLLTAIALAGQSIVMDYLMGILIILEGQYYEGDWIQVGAVAGDVESVGLRRTVIRDTSGTVHSISHGEMRTLSNETRVFAAAEVTVSGIRQEDLERVLAVITRVGDDLAHDPDWSARILEPPEPRYVPDFTEAGITVKVRGRVPGGERWLVASELNRRLAAAFVAEGIDLDRPGVPSRILRSARAQNAIDASETA